MKLVNFINWYSDSSRRDLTYNAMSLALDGTLFDYFGGVDDLNNHRTAFVGDATKRIREDYLRILRYFRFMGRQPSVVWDDATMAAIAKNSKGLERISGERIWAEISKILAGNHVVELIQGMGWTKVLKHCGFDPMRNPVKIQNLKDQGVDDPRIVLAAMVGTPADLINLQKRWKWDSDSHKLMMFLVQNRGIKLSFDTLIRMVVLENADRGHLEALCVYRGMKSMAQGIKTWVMPTFPLSGNDLIAVGMERNKQLGEMIKSLKEVWLDSDFTLSKEQLVQQALKIRLSQ